jgi:general secretion pathway protein M
VNLRVEKIVENPVASRAIALLLLLIVVSGVGYLVSLELEQQHQRYEDIIERRTLLIAGYQRVAANRSDIEKTIANVKKLDTARYYLRNSSPSLAAAEVQDYAQAIFEANGMKVNSVSISPHKDEDGRRKVGVNFNLRGTSEATQKSFYALESQLPYLFVDNLALRSTVNSRRWQPTPDVEPEIQVQFDLYGYAQIRKIK